MDSDTNDTFAGDFWTKLHPVPSVGCLVPVTIREKAVLPKAVTTKSVLVLSSGPETFNSI